MFSVNVSLFLISNQGKQNMLYIAQAVPILEKKINEIYSRFIVDA
jgi:hypothetical protein